jgi:hypothetical protein
MFGSIQHFWARGLPQKLAVVASAVLLLMCACCSSLVVLGAVVGGNNQSGTQTGQATSTAKLPTPTSTTTAISPTSTATAIPTPTRTPAPAGYPHVGGPFSDFVAAYGQPVPNGSSSNFFTDKAQTIAISVDQTNGIVTGMDIVGPTSWTNQQTFDYCTQFLPHGAVEYNSVGQYTDYHSSAGDVVIGVYGEGTATINLSQ